jgi:uncharacterized repeat protein (TIGR03943 family)
VSSHGAHREISADTQGGVLIVLAATGLRLSLTDAFARFIRPGMRIPLIAASVVLAALGIATLARSWRAHRRPASAEHQHDERQHDKHQHDDHQHGSFVSWLLIAPVAVLLLVAPASLGAYAASRGAVRTTQLAQSQGAEVGTLPPATKGATQLSLTSYSNFALYDTKEQLKGRPVRLVGFVAHDSAAPGGYYLTRFVIACCAADAFPVQVVLHGKVPALPDDTWITVEGTWHPTTTNPEGNDVFRAELDVTSVTATAKPGEPYEG